MGRSRAADFVSDLARWARDAQSRVVFRRGVLERVTATFGATVAVFGSIPPALGGASIATVGVRPHAVALAWAGASRALVTWARPSAWTGTRDDAPAWLLPSASLAPDVRALASVRAGESRRGPSLLVLGRPGEVLSGEELELLDAASPVLQLGDERHLEVAETVGAQLSPREREIFDFLVRGYRNEDIARALGTSPATVRNQLVRLYRKTGVASRSELVGLATSQVLPATTAGEGP